VRAYPAPTRIGELIEGLEAERDACERRRTVLDTAIGELRREWAEPHSTPAPAGKAPAKHPGWKHRRRCPQCQQLTPSDPCASCRKPFSAAPAD
jgi:hypothetical protein